MLFFVIALMGSLQLWGAIAQIPGNTRATLPTDVLKILQEQLYRRIDQKNMLESFDQIAAAKRISLSCKNMHNDSSLSLFVTGTKNISLMALFGHDIFSILTISQEKSPATKNSVERYDSMTSFASLTIAAMNSILAEYKKMRSASLNVHKNTHVKATITNFSKQCKRLPIEKISNLFIRAPHKISSYQTAVLDLINDQEYDTLQALSSNGWPLITTEPLGSKMILFPGFTNGLPITKEPVQWGHHVGRLQELMRAERASPYEQIIISKILNSSYWLIKMDTTGSELEIAPPRNQQKACSII